MGSRHRDGQGPPAWWGAAAVVGVAAVAPSGRGRLQPTGDGSGGAGNSRIIWERITSLIFEAISSSSPELMAIRPHSPAPAQVLGDHQTENRSVLGYTTQKPQSVPIIGMAHRTSGNAENRKGGTGGIRRFGYHPYTLDSRSNVYPWHFLHRTRPYYNSNNST